ncbi:hypothetical protein, variant 1, partial [Fonticula alba]
APRPPPPAACTMSQSERLRMRPAPPKCLAISSHVSFGGRAGLRASMPAYVALGVDASEVGTCHLSNHTGYRLFPGRVAAPGEIRSLAAGAQANGLLRAGPDGRQAAFRVVCTGYMASVPQSREIAELVAAARAGPGPGPLYVMDPVLGDDGELYVPSVLLPRALRMVLLSPQMSRRLLCLSEPDQLLLLGTGEAGTKRGLSRGGQAPADGGALPGGPTLTYFPQTRVDVLTPNQFELEQLAYPPEAGHAQAPAAVAGLEGLCAALWRVHRAYQVPAIVCTSTSYLGCRHRDPAAASACTSSFRHAGASAGGPAGAGPGAPPAEAFCCEDSCVDLRAFVPPGGRPADERFVAMEVVASFIPRERLAQLASVLPADVVDDGPDAPEPGIVAAADVAAELFRPVRFAVVRRTKYVSGTGDLFAAMVSARLAHALHAGGAFSEESFLDGAPGWPASRSRLRRARHGCGGQPPLLPPFLLLFFFPPSCRPSAPAPPPFRMGP